ncbi:MAG: alginate export family protein [Salinisphaeraceae bacterium]
MTRMRTRHWIILGALVAGPAGAGPLTGAITDGQASLHLNLRFEQAEQQGRDDAGALTLRPRLGYQTGTWRDLDAFAEFEGVYAIGGDDRYNSGPPFLNATNGNTSFATIADPTGDQMNRAWLRYRGLPASTLTVGRQRLILDNARFVGNVGWRQNEQTFDAITLVNEWLPNLTLTYVYFWRQNFIFFNDNRMNSHLVNANWRVHPKLALTGFAYFIDFDRKANALRAPGAPDHRVLGVRATGSLQRLRYELAYAEQSDYGEAPTTVDADYWQLQLSLAGLPVTPTLGYEGLGGDGTYGFRFPLATNHAFQGWADVFLVTPPDGIADRYLKLSADAGPVRLAAAFHDLRAERGNADYGHEIDLSVAFPVNEQFSLLAKFADYRAEEFAVDTRRLWLQATVEF